MDLKLFMSLLAAARPYIAIILHTFANKLRCQRQRSREKYFRSFKYRSRSYAKTWDFVTRKFVHLNACWCLFLFLNTVSNSVVTFIQIDNFVYVSVFVLRGYKSIANSNSLSFIRLTSLDFLKKNVLLFFFIINSVPYFMIFSKI